MNYELMHKDVAVAKVDIDTDGAIKKLVEIIDASHFPYGTAPKKNRLDPTGLKRWWENRRIPMSRDDIEHLTNTVINENSTTLSLLLACKGLSLSDSYWIRKDGSTESFADVSFFENGFSMDLGDVLVGKDIGERPSFMSPDATSEGNLKKRWKIINGKRTLLKTGTPPLNYEVYNEVIASAVMSHLGIPHVDYQIIMDSNDIYCACDDFVDYSQDFVTAYMIYEAGDKKNNESLYAFFIRKFSELGIEHPKTALDQMLLVDYLLGNEDRHLNNFGLLRDAKSLNFMAFAPIFDTGSSLGFNQTDASLSESGPAKWKPFASNAKPTQLDYIEELPNISDDALRSLFSIVKSTCDAFGNALSSGRKKAIERFVHNRIMEVIAHFGIAIIGKEEDLTLIQQEILKYIASIGGKLYHADDLCTPLHTTKITAMRNLIALTNSNKLRRVGARKNGYWEINPQ